MTIANPFYSTARIVLLVKDNDHYMNPKIMEIINVQVWMYKHTNNLIGSHIHTNIILKVCTLIHKHAYVCILKHYLYYAHKFVESQVI